MQNEKIQKICKILVIACAAVGIASLVMFIPAVRNFIIDLGELYVGRQLTREVWHGRLIKWESLFLTSLILFCVCVVFFPRIMIWGNSSIREKKLCDFLKIPNFLPLVALSTFVYFIGIIAIVRANFYYIDDLGRSVDGYHGWKNFSRYLSDFLSTFIHCGLYLTDISPLPQIIAVIICGISSVIVVALMSENRSLSVQKLIAALPIGLSPYFLECLSYKYDSPYMALSVLVSIAPFLFLPSQSERFKKNEMKENLANFAPFVIASFLGILAMCMLYQASSGIYPMIALLLVLKRWNKKKPFMFFLASSVFAYFFALLFFKLFVMTPTSTYVSNEIPALPALIPHGIKNLAAYFSLVWSDYKKMWLILHGIIFVLFVLTSSFQSSRKKKISLPVNAFLSLVILSLSFGMYPILSTPLFAPRALYGFGVLFGLLSVEVIGNSRSWYAKIPSFAISWIFLVFAFTYGNALSEQKRYTDFRIQLVLQDLNDIDAFANSSTKNVRLDGNIGKSPVIENQPKNYQMLTRLVPSTFGGNEWMWNQKYFYSYFSLRNINPILGYEEDKKDNPVDLRKLNLPILKDSMYHTIRGDGENFLIELK